MEFQSGYANITVRIYVLKMHAMRDYSGHMHCDATHAHHYSQSVLGVVTHF